MSTNQYLSSTTATTGGITYFDPSSYTIVSSASITKPSVQISPQLYFKFIKKGFKTLESFKFDRRIKKLEKAFDEAVKNGQIVLSEKILDACVKEAKESAAYAKGFKIYIEKEVLDKYKRKIRDGHISDTVFSQYTRIIPKKVLEKKKQADGIFDGYVIYHYWNEEAQKDAKKMTSTEKAAMRDPVLFGVIRNSDRLYFIADWEDEYCHLTFDELVDVVGDDNVGELTHVPELLNT